jgi:hypothetical protein
VGKGDTLEIWSRLYNNSVSVKIDSMKEITHYIFSFPASAPMSVTAADESSPESSDDIAAARFTLAPVLLLQVRHKRILTR